MNKEEKMLLFQKRVKLFMAYCEEFGFPQLKDGIRFCDIDSNTKDDCKIYTWFYNQNLNELEKMIELYKDIYPKAYDYLKNRQLDKTKKLSNESRLEYFMKYCEEFGFPQFKGGIRFCDIDPKINDCRKVYTWFRDQDLKELEKKIELYKDIYPKTYACIKNRLSDNSKNYASRLESFMKYVEHYGWLSERSKIRFCDIDKNSQDTVIVGIWYAQFFRANGELVKQIAIQKQTTYPKASQEILSRFEKTALPYEERLKLVMQYIEEFDVLEIEAGLTFADLGELISSEDMPKNSKDTMEVKEWFDYRKRTNQDKLMKICILYAKQYSKAYAWIIDKIEKLQKHREQQVLSFQERTFLYLSYLNQEQNKVVVSASRLKFSDLPNDDLIDDLDSNDLDFPNLIAPISDEALISSWLYKVLKENIKALTDECLKYQAIYPLGVQKMQRLIDKFRSLLIFEYKMQLFMKEVEANGIPSQKSPIRFCNLDPSCKDETLVGIWFTREMSRSHERFIATFIQYKDTYPKAYEEIKNYINRSNACLKKDRARLIETLRSIRYKMANSTEASTGTKVVKNLTRRNNIC